MNRIELRGCASNPLIMNLKALGIFRTIAEQKDPTVMASWNGDVFELHTKMTKKEMVGFFLDQYIPTPIVSPWNGGSGFYEKEGEGIETIENVKHRNSKKYCDVFEETRKIISTHVPEYELFLKQRNIPAKEFREKAKKIKKKIQDAKTLLLGQCRNKLPDDLMSWLDAMYVITSDKPSIGTILGTMGNDGNFEISANFMEYIKNCVFTSKETKDRSQEWINGALFGENAKLVEGSSAYFYPGGYIGPNNTSDGFKEYSFVNPWDYILMIEGTMIFAGSISRRSKSKKAAFPFTVDSSAAGYNTSSNEKSRGEVWIPLWENPATYDEIKYIFNEGRAQIGVRNSNTGTDFVRALTSLGTERGMSGFQRFGMFERKGQAFFANNIGRIKTAENTQINLFTEIDVWLNNVRRVKNIPQSISSLLNIIDDAIINFCIHKRESDLQKVLINLGKIEMTISKSSSLREEIKEPLQYLSAEWVHAAYDATPEFRLAVSLSAMTDKKKYSIRCNLEQVRKKHDKIEWAPGSPHTVFTRNNLIQNLTAILERRCLDSHIQKSTDIMLESEIYAPINDIMFFLEDRIDFKKISELLLPLSIIDYKDHIPSWDNDREIFEIPQFLPESYVVIKSNFPPIPPMNNEKKMFESSVIGLLKSGNMDRVERIMQRRLLINGRKTLTYGCFMSDALQEISKDKINRFTASLLFPLRKSDMDKILKIITGQKSKNIL